MGWAKYTEDNKEIYYERIDQIKEYKRRDIITEIHSMAYSTGVSVKCSSVEEKTVFNNKYKDKNLYCRNCEKEFVFSVGEQQFYEKKAFQLPKHCRACRKTNKIKQVSFK